ncbi:hypothetical protein Tco_0149834 [Tanacetum coccineum]
MTTLVEFMILSGGENGPPMLEKPLYDSWKSRMKLYMQNREHGRMILESVEHGPLIWPMIEENRVTMTKKYAELVAKDLWERVQLLMQGTSLKKQESECKLYDEFDKFAYIKGLSPEWSKFFTDVKLVRDSHTTNFDQLHAYLQQHELHANEIRIMPTPLAIIYPSVPYLNAYSSTIHQDACPQPQSIPQIEYTVSIVNQHIHLAKFPQIDSGLAVPVFKQRDDPIDAINKMMLFLSTVVTSHYPSTNNHLRNSSNLRQQATIHNGRVTVQSVQGRQSSFAAGEGYMSRQCLKPKRKRDATWFRDKVLLVEVQGPGKVLNEEELVFLADPRVAEGPVTHTVITHNAAYQADELDAYDSDCDEISMAKAVLMANLSSYGPDVLSKVPHSKNTHNDMLNQSMQEMPYSEQTHFVNYPKNEITSDSNIIPYSQYLLETKNAAVQDTNSSAQQDAMILSVFEQLSNQEAKNIDKEIALEKKIKELDNIVYKMGQSAQTMHMLTKPQVFYDNNLKQALGFHNPFYLKKAQQIRLMLYDGIVITKETNVILIADSEETLMLEEESRSKMF